jgi:hypothetical protein
MRENDFVPQEIRIIENIIDNTYKANALINLPFNTAIWYLLSAYEDTSIRGILEEGSTEKEWAMDADKNLFESQYPIYWLWNSCKPGGEITLKYDQYWYDQAIKLINLAHTYEAFVIAFTYASNGLCKLTLDGKLIRTDFSKAGDLQYEVYSRKVQLKTIEDEASANLSFLHNLEKEVKVADGSFSYRINKRMIEKSYKYHKQSFKHVYELPSHWEFSRYSLLEYKEVTKYLRIKAHLHKLARMIAIKRGIKDFGYTRGVLIINIEELFSELLRFTSVKRRKVEDIIEDLTYGSHELNRMDSALQPIIKINREEILFSPFLIENNSFERNLMILLNKIPSEKDIYSRLVNEKEEYMKRSIIENIHIDSIRYWSGKINKYGGAVLATLFIR